VRIVRARGKEPRHGNLIPEFERIVLAAQPRWFLMEESPNAPLPAVPGYIVRQRVINNRWLGETQNRERRFSFGTSEGLKFGAIEFVALEAFTWHHAVTSTHRAIPIAIGGSGKRKTGLDARSGPRAGLGEMLELQGFPRTMLDECPLTMEGKKQAVGNGVPLAMGRAVAAAVRQALGYAFPVSEEPDGGSLAEILSEE
jgi:DNA (cytosine-5)-methyltransferase 1